MKKQPILYVLLGMLIVVFCGAFVSVLRTSNQAAGDVFHDLHEAASNAYNQQQGNPYAQTTQSYYEQPSQSYYEQSTQHYVAQASQPADSQPNVQNPVMTNPSVVLDVTAGKQEILNAMCTAVNSVKTAQNFGAVKYQNIEVKLDSCSVSIAVPIVNPIIKNFTGEETLNYQFVDGTCIGPKSGEPVTPNLVIPPSDRLFALDGNGVTAAVVTKNGYDTTYSISLVSETATLANPAPYYHALCMDYLDMSTMDFGVAKLTKADFSYAGATVNVTVNQLGQIIRYEEYMPIAATGEGSVGFTASGSISGFLHEIWTFTW